MKLPDGDLVSSITEQAEIAHRLEILKHAAGRLRHSGSCSIGSVENLCHQMSSRGLYQPGFPGWHWTPRIITCRLTAQIQSLFRRSGHEVRRIQWVKAARTLFGWVLTAV